MAKQANDNKEFNPASITHGRVTILEDFEHEGLSYRQGPLDVTVDFARYLVAEGKAVPRVNVDTILKKGK